VTPAITKGVFKELIGIHFKISSRIYSLRVTFLYSFRPTLALF
jgi:hypothetical protein